MNKEFYVSLVRGLLGYFVLFQSPNEDWVRDYCAKYFGKIWCSIYTPEQLVSMKWKHIVVTIVLNNKDEINLR